ncbi:MAG: NUDIX domain-containing protein [Candidatus Micrarchaeota archaeon]
MEEEHRDRHKGSQLLFAVDEKGNLSGKLVRRWDAHTSPGIKHLAYGILVVNSKGEFVLHKRAERKVGGGKLDLPVSHVLSTETHEQAFSRTLKEEYGIEAKLSFEDYGGFSYEEHYEDGTCENEFCLVIITHYGGPFHPNPKEVEGELVFLPGKKALQEIRERPLEYTIWFREAIKLLSKHSEGKKYIQ